MSIRPGPWIPDTIPPLQASIARCALLDVGICEDPPGSNRSPIIDDYLARVGAPTGLPWCAAAVSAWYRDAGAEVPPRLGASTDEWMRWAKALGLWTSTPGIGYAVVYGKRTAAGDDAEHIGVVVQLTPLLLAVEGNTSMGTAAEREGIAVDIKPVNVGWRLGYVRPVPVS